MKWAPSWSALQTTTSEAGSAVSWMALAGSSCRWSFESCRSLEKTWTFGRLLWNLPLRWSFLSFIVLNWSQMISGGLLPFRCSSEACFSAGVHVRNSLQWSLWAIVFIIKKSLHLLSIWYVSLDNLLGETFVIYLLLWRAIMMTHWALPTFNSETLLLSAWQS